MTLDKALTITGLLLTLAGTALAGSALVQDMHRYSGRKLVAPYLRSALYWLRANVLRRRIHIGAPAGTVMTETVIVADGVVARLVPGADEPTDVQLAYLRREVDGLHDLLDMHKSETGRAVASLRESVTAASDDAHRAIGDVDAMAREIATGSVPLQLWGLLLIGVGSVLAAIPALL